VHAHALKQISDILFIFNLLKNRTKTSESILSNSNNTKAKQEINQRTTYYEKMHSGRINQRERGKTFLIWVKTKTITIEKRDDENNAVEKES